MKTKILFIAIFIATLNSFAQTSVPGGNVSGTWSLAGSPYNIQGSIMIPNDSMLTIDAGVTVSFQGHYQLLVLGRLLAIGTTTDTITFIAADTTNGWMGIRFSNTTSNNDSSKIIYCKLQYGNATGTYPNGWGGALFFSSFSKATVSHCLISECKAFGGGGGILCYRSNPIISYNTIVNNMVTGGNNNASFQGGGGIYVHSCSPTITYNYISNNTTAVSSGGGAFGGGGIYCYRDTAYIAYNIIFNNFSVASFTNGGGAGIKCYVYSRAIITHNIICNNTVSGGGTDNGGGGIYSGYGSSPHIINNIISNNMAPQGGALLVTNNSGSEIINITNNTIANNTAVNGGALYCNLNSNPTFRNCILWGNTATLGAQVYLLDDASDPDFYYCDVQSGSGAFEVNGNFFTGAYSNNINADPLFISPSGGAGTGYNGLSADWSFPTTSSCINTGTPDTTGLHLLSTDIAGNQRIISDTIDIGAYEGNGNPCTQYVTVYDTVTVNDTITFNDTITTNIYDTTFITINDTVTTYISVTDTLFINAVLTGINPPDNINTLKVFPNPANTHIVIDNGNFNQMNGYTLRIDNSLGQTVFTSLINQQQFSVNLSTWTGKGTYYVYVIDQLLNTIDVRKIVIQ